MSNSGGILRETIVPVRAAVAAGLRDVEPRSPPGGHVVGCTQDPYHHAHYPYRVLGRGPRYPRAG